MSVIITKIIFR